MSDQEQQNPSQENEDEDEEENSEEQEDGDQDQQDQDGQDQDQQGDQDDQQDGQDQQQQEDQSKQEDDQQKKPQKLPKFRSLEPQQFKFTSLLAEISSLSVNVDKFIGTLPSNGGCTYRSYVPPPRTYAPLPQVPLILPQQSKIVVMKDQDVQVSMQPQIVIQPTRVEKAPLQPTYKISNESNKFLAQLYEQNKKLKRWQNTSHNMNSHTGISSVGSGFYGSRERFQRQNYEKGLFNVEQRNREIDEAIQKLRTDEL